MNKVNLIAITSPTIPEAGNAEEFIAYCARISNPGNQHNYATASRLLKYLVTNGHWSPFEMVHAVMEVNTTRDIARQILRHRSFSFQEFSQRYSVAQDGCVIREARMQDVVNRQNSIETEDVGVKEWWSLNQEFIATKAQQVYKLALSKGIAKEVARAVLPEGLTMSKLYVSGSLRSWIHYIQLRCGSGTQKEHRELAEACKLVILDAAPSLKEILDAR